MKKIFIPIILTSIACSAFAGKYSTNSYGPTVSADIANEVTDEFTKAYPYTKYEIYLYSDAGQLTTGKRYCYAIAGVSPKNSNKMPISRYSSTKVSNDSYDTVMLEGEKKEWAAECANIAVKNMMSDKMSNIYSPMMMCQVTLQTKHTLLKLTI